MKCLHRVGLDRKGICLFQFICLFLQADFRIDIGGQMGIIHNNKGYGFEFVLYLTLTKSIRLIPYNLFK